MTASCTCVDTAQIADGITEDMVIAGVDAYLNHSADEMETLVKHIFIAMLEADESEGKARVSTP
jgi:hypothetical protein